MAARTAFSKEQRSRGHGDDLSAAQVEALELAMWHVRDAAPVAWYSVGVR